MKLIHCADIHLDSPMEASLPLEKATERRQEVLYSFLKLIDFAAENQVDAVLIAGDLFDSDYPSSETLAAVLSAMEEKKDVDFLYLGGNHDFFSKQLLRGEKLPPNLKSFSSQWSSFHYGDTEVFGIEFSEENCLDLYNSLRLDPHMINIVALHGQVSSSRGMDLIDLKGLSGKGIDYLALGHLHSFQEFSLGERGKAVYSGCLEGRGFDECGEKGFVFLETGNGRVTYRFIPFCKRQVCQCTVDISQCESLLDLRAAIRQETETLEPSCIVRALLVGEYPAEFEKNLSYFRQELQNRFFFGEVKDLSRLRIRYQDYEKDVSLRGAFVRLVLEGEYPPEEKDLMLSYGLRALKGEEPEQ